MDQIDQQTWWWADIPVTWNCTWPSKNFVQHHKVELLSPMMKLADSQQTKREQKKRMRSHRLVVQIKCSPFRPAQPKTLLTARDWHLNRRWWTTKPGKAMATLLWYLRCLANLQWSRVELTSNLYRERERVSLPRYNWNSTDVRTERTEWTNKRDIFSKKVDTLGLLLSL